MNVTQNFNKLLYKAVSLNATSAFCTPAEKKRLKFIEFQSWGLFLSSMWTEILVCDVSHPTVCKDSRIDFFSRGDECVCGKCSVCI
jgi:hypothetical protein